MKNLSVRILVVAAGLAVAGAAQAGRNDGEEPAGSHGRRGMVRDRDGSGRDHACRPEGEHRRRERPPARRECREPEVIIYPQDSDPGLWLPLSPGGGNETPDRFRPTPIPRRPVFMLPGMP